MRSPVAANGSQEPTGVAGGDEPESGWLSPLARAERILQWEAYLHTLEVYLQVLQRMVPNPLMSTKHLAERFGVSPRTIRRRKAKGEIAPAAVIGRGRGGHRWRGNELGGETGGAGLP